MTVFLRWSTAFLMACLVVAFTPFFADDLKTDPLVSDELLGSVLNSDVVFIGTSLFAFGIPRYGKGLLEEESTHTRLAWSSMSENDMLDLLERTLQISGIKTVVLELNPFIRAYRHAVETSPTLLDSIRNQSRQFKQDLNIVSQHLLFRWLPQKSKFIDEPPIDQNTKLDVAIFSRIYPFFIRPPEQPSRLIELLRIAESHSVEVHFVLPPRAQTAANYLGEDQLIKLKREADKFGETFGVQIWHAGASWEDHLFVDHAHLNRSGRDKFISFLKAQVEQVNVQ